MKVYYICECCDEVFLVKDTEGPEGAIAMQGICDSCALEMGLADTNNLRSQMFYN
ncbi:MAG: hypothetical protein U9N81_14435 [Bacillota bacterium]|nr:hypothetical protein [Bacillota bacterium]